MPFVGVWCYERSGIATEVLTLMIGWVWSRKYDDECLSLVVSAGVSSLTKAIRYFLLKRWLPMFLLGMSGFRSLLWFPVTLPGNFGKGNSLSLGHFSAKGVSLAFDSGWPISVYVFLRVERSMFCIVWPSSRHQIQKESGRCDAVICAMDFLGPICVHSLSSTN